MKPANQIKSGSGGALRVTPAAWLLLLGCSASLGTLVAPLISAQQPNAGLINREYEIKAAYLYNFGNYIQWPEVYDSFTIGVVGRDPFGALLNQIANAKTINGKRIVIQHFTSAEQYQPCQILFIAGDAGAQLAAVLVKTQGKAVLLVGDTPGFAQQRVTINFYIEQNTVKFEINQAAAQRAGLKISARLLQLGKLVTEG